ncbi:CopG domain protein DNA-binding domain protein [Planktothrix sp. PCC 11201]|uniref:ribbon-helix-helix domain-containing protein n=1 Tax=Planktothrix sp. PCC 11201 TaxID=1729650 RepID=UPI00091959B6|nr:ribbon-helix-helix domain-containing protein [Planktothrix sp. PCC 11201]SKB14771.1 CopG domain protein DNA-binding domain protein [Planktothrix sp. PCC 11201]
MPETKISLDEPLQNALAEISRETGKTQSQLISEAVEQLIKDYQRQNRYLLIQQAKGVWADREDIDIPDLQHLRQEWQRF